MPYAVAVVKPTEEFRARDALVADGHTVYCPLIYLERLNRWKGMLRYPVPMFPGYFFVDDAKIKGGSIWIKPNDTVRLLLRDKRVLLVPDKDISRVQSIEKELSEKKHPDKELKLKDLVEVMEGFMKGRLGRIVGFRKRMAVVSFADQFGKLDLFVNIGDLKREQK